MRTPPCHMLRYAASGASPPLLTLKLKLNLNLNLTHYASDDFASKFPSSACPVEWLVKVIPLAALVVVHNRVIRPSTPAPLRARVRSPLCFGTRFPAPSR
jgi:hypothetical protein